MTNIADPIAGISKLSHTLWPARAKHHSIALHLGPQSLESVILNADVAFIVWWAFFSTYNEMDMNDFLQGFAKGAKETPKGYFAPAIAIWRLLVGVSESLTKGKTRGNRSKNEH